MTGALCGTIVFASTLQSGFSPRADRADQDTTDHIMTTPKTPKTPSAPSPWVVRFTGCIREGGTVLDLACGRGRHSRFLLEHGHLVVGADRDLSGVADLLGHAKFEAQEAELEGDAWPLGGQSFDGVVVTNYLYRPRLSELADLLSEDGILIYETFAKGQEAFGRPTNPDFLLAPNELLDVFSPLLEIIAFEQKVDTEPRLALRQRLVARRRSAK
ncbi:MAG: class I SAM-dependent methyltransferase [Myxococcota bacterium]